MTTYKKGDRVRITYAHEGEVMDANEVGIIINRDDHGGAWYHHHSDPAKIEKLADPEPTWVNGDVIEVRGYVPMHRLGANWYNRAAEVHFLSGQPMQISKAWRLGEVTILYKADQPDGSSAAGKADAEPEVQKKVA